MRRKSFKGKKPSQSVKKFVKTQINRTLRENQETKFFDIVSNATGVPGSGTVVQLNPIVQGINESQRIGSAIKPISLRGKFGVVGVDNVNAVRILIVQWNDDDAIFGPTLARIFQDPINSPWLGTLNENNMTGGMFTVKYDRLFTTSLNGQNAFSVNFHTKKLRKVDYLGSATTGYGNLYLIAVSDSAIAGHPTLAYQMRLSYTDS